jgi:signal transduction histidine kinase
MQERVSTLGGRVEFLSQPGSGTTILVELPIFWMTARG